MDNSNITVKLNLSDSKIAIKPITWKNKNGGKREENGMDAVCLMAHIYQNHSVVLMQ